MMSEGRRKKLDSVGFIWNVRKAKKSIAFHWKVRFQELVEYKRIHGHCNIHKGYAANPQLALLVGTQRSTKETMSENRRNKLNSIDFVWSLTAGSSKDNDSALIEDLKSTLKSWVERLIEIKIKHFPGETMPSPAQLHVAELLKNSKASEYELAETMKVLNLELLTEGL